MEKIMIQIKKSLRSFMKHAHSKVFREISQPRRKYTPSEDVYASFVAIFSDDARMDFKEKVPALWHVKGGKERVLSYLFPRNPDDFFNMDVPVKGEMPWASAVSAPRRSRFGFTGLCVVGDYIYAGSWNGIYKICKKTLELDSFITHHLMNYIHGIYCDDEYIYTCLTCKDTLVISDYEGNIVDKFSISPDMKVVEDSQVDEHDWRFISKIFKGSSGFFHFNYIQKFGDEVYLTSRNINSFVIVNLRTRKCSLMPINHKVPVLLHDGLKIGDKYYFTSIDGAIIAAETLESDLYNMGKKAEIIILKRQPSWCRGIAKKDGNLLSCVDGRYGGDLSFGIQAISFEGKYVGEMRFSYKKAGLNKYLMSVTGFDIV